MWEGDWRWGWVCWQLLQPLLAGVPDAPRHMLQPLWYHLGAVVDRIRRSVWRNLRCNFHPTPPPRSAAVRRRQLVEMLWGEAGREWGGRSGREWINVQPLRCFLYGSQGWCRPTLIPQLLGSQIPAEAMPRAEEEKKTTQEECEICGSAPRLTVWTDFSRCVSPSDKEFVARNNVQAS